MKNLGKQCGLCVWFRKKKSIKAQSCREKGCLETSPCCPRWELDDRNLPKNVRQLLYLLPELTLRQIKALLYFVRDKPVDFTTEGITKTCGQCVRFRKKYNGKSCKQSGIKASASCCKKWELDFSTTHSIFREAYSSIAGIPDKGPWDLIKYLLQKAQTQYGGDFTLGEPIGFRYHRIEGSDREFFVKGRIVDISEANLLMRTKSGRYFNILRRHAIKKDQWDSHMQYAVKRKRKGKTNARDC